MSEIRPIVERSHFLELAMLLVAESRYRAEVVRGALDTYAEQNGREQAERLRSCLGEVEASGCQCGQRRSKQC